MAMLRKSALSWRALIAVGLGVVVSVVAALVLYGPSGGSKVVSAADIFARAESAAKERPQPGEVIHLETRTFFRYGSAAARIMAEAGVGPETTVADTWALTGDDGLPKAAYTLTYDKGGLLLFTTFTDATKSEVRDANGGLVRGFEFPPGFTQQDVGEENRQRFGGTLESGKARLVGESTFRGASTFIIEWELSQIPGTSGDNGITVPYVADLDASRIVLRVEFDQGTYRPIKTEHSAVSPGGLATVIYSQEELTYEVLGTSGLPPAIAALLTP